VLGGTRSGKSAIAESLVTRLAADAPVTYIATGWRSDDDMTARIERHQARRPDRWSTVEAGADLVGALVGAASAPVLVDALGTWVAQHFDQPTGGFPVDGPSLCGALADRGDAVTVVVSDEVSMSVHAESASVRRYVDVLGDVNQAVAQIADEVLLVVAGRVTRLERWEP
jgi:adenosylcobinamide kinase / adenosylcobinamide-phosphate guanylyltransferase